MHYCSEGCLAEDWSQHASECIGGLFGNKWKGLVQNYTQALFELFERRLEFANNDAEENDVTAAVNKAKMQGTMWMLLFEEEIRQAFVDNFENIVDAWNALLQEYITRGENNETNRIKRQLLSSSEPSLGNNLVNMIAGRKNRDAVEQAWNWLVMSLYRVFGRNAVRMNALYALDRLEVIDNAAKVERAFNGGKWVAPSRN